MGSDISNFLGLRKDLKKFIIGKEIESGKDRSLLLEIISKSFLDNFKVLVGLLEFLLKSFLRAALNNGGGLECLVDLLSPCGVYRLESLGFLRKLLHDIRRVENGLKVHPLSLALNPLFKSI
jgi:hypothetical protein